MNEIKMQHEKRRQEKVKEKEAIQDFLRQEKTKMREDEILARKEKVAFEKRQQQLKVQRKIAVDKKIATAHAFRRIWQMKNLLGVLTRSRNRVFSLEKSIKSKAELSTKAKCLQLMSSLCTQLLDKQRKLIRRAAEFNCKLRCRFIFDLLKVNVQAKNHEKLLESKKIRLGFVFRKWRRRLTHIKVNNYELTKTIEQKRREAIRVKCFRGIKKFTQQQMAQKMQVQMKEVTKEELKQKAAAWLSEFRARRG